MASIFDRYGIKEVADVTFYSLKGNGQIGAPVLYLDTLKISTAEQTAESTEARGGKGNAPLMTWDYGKEVIVNLEDALFSQHSLEVMYGGKQVSHTRKITKTKNYTIKKGNAYPFFVYKTEDDEGWYFNSENAKNFGLPWITIYADGENTKLVEGRGNATATYKISSIIKDMEYVSCYGDIDSGISVDSVLEGETPSFELNLGPLDETGAKIVEILPKNGTYHFQVSWTAEVVSDQTEYSKHIFYSYSYKTAIGYEGFQFIENGKDLRGEGALILNKEIIPLQGVIDPALLISAGLDTEGKSEINLTGTHLFQFELLAEGNRLVQHNEIEITANTFPGTYYVTADTYVRNEKTGKDEFFQLILPKVKVLSESNTITMEADGDPTVFNMSLKALKDGSKPLMQLISYSESNKTVVKGTGSTMGTVAVRTAAYVGTINEFSANEPVPASVIPSNASVTITAVGRCKGLNISAEYNDEDDKWYFSGSFSGDYGYVTDDTVEIFYAYEYLD